MKEEKEKRASVPAKSKRKILIYQHLKKITRIFTIMATFASISGITLKDLVDYFLRYFS